MDMKAAFIDRDGVLTLTVAMFINGKVINGFLDLLRR